MGKIRKLGGWLLYSGDIGTITADVISADMSFRASHLDVTSIESPVRQVLYGPPDVTFTAQLTEKLQWDKTGTAGERPHLGALLTLALRHPEEYRWLRETEAVLKALGG